MSILVISESSNRSLKKTSFELCSYAKAWTSNSGGEVVALTFNTDNAEELSKYGADKIINIESESFEMFSAETYANAIVAAAKTTDIKTVLISSSTDALYLAPIITAKLRASYASNVVELPSSYEPLTVKRKAFTNKAFMKTTLDNEYKIISLSKNAFGISEQSTNAGVERAELNIEADSMDIKIESKETNDGQVSIADADIVVSAGRGLKGPENWGMVEELADVLGAATACSKPVSDLGWRPHSEHVGQTGKPVASNLYIAIGISGAIQHLAGINASKIKVVVNTDPEAPFFKAADYGIVGDAFEVVPQLIEKFKAFKQ